MAEISRWSCNEGSGLTARDSIGGRDLTLTNGPTWGPAVVIYDGVNDHSIRSSVDLGFNGATEFSISFTLKTSDSTGRVIQKPFVTDVGLNTFRIYISATGIINFELDGSVLGAPTWFNVDAIDFSTTKRVAFTWKAVDFAGADGAIYIDGVPVTVDLTVNDYQTGFTMFEASSVFIVAIRPFTLTDPLAGEVGDIRIFNTQLTSGQVAALSSALTQKQKIIKQAVKRASYW